MSTAVPPPAIGHASQSEPAEASPLLEVQGLTTRFSTHGGLVHAVEDVSFRLMPGETLGVVGESGCGKSVTGLSIMRLVPDPPGRTVGGKVIFLGQDLLTLSETEMEDVRGRDMAMIFQDPMTSLNPVMTIGRQIAEPLRRHRGLSELEARARVVELLEMVGIPDARTRASQYPHQFSGGMRQRAMIAMALSCDPRLIIADEPTTALDVTTQAQILDLLRSLQARHGTGVMMITHSMGVVAGIADRMQVMYAGSIVETGSTTEVFAGPRHPYTVGLMKSIPRLDVGGHGKLQPIKGSPANLVDPPNACPFAPRCVYARAKCIEEKPPLMKIAPDHASACWFWQEVSIAESTARRAGEMRPGN